eukprot:GHVN01003377.1.p1 GENE.GHVN01003377.1~~GHVN01003377.1.p1  ORF type:complete len:967 (+),score=210.74 GHVN01003377.1:957-3857(+)
MANVPTATPPPPVDPIPVSSFPTGTPPTAPDIAPPTAPDIAPASNASTSAAAAPTASQTDSVPVSNNPSGVVDLSAKGNVAQLAQLPQHAPEVVNEQAAPINTTIEIPVDGVLHIYLDRSTQHGVPGGEGVPPPQQPQQTQQHTQGQPLQTLVVQKLTTNVQDATAVHLVGTGKPPVQASVPIDGEDAYTKLLSSVLSDHTEMLVKDKQFLAEYRMRMGVETEDHRQALFKLGWTPQQFEGAIGEIPPTTYPPHPNPAQISQSTTSPQTPNPVAPPHSNSASTPHTPPVSATVPPQQPPLASNQLHTVSAIPPQPQASHVPNLSQPPPPTFPPPPTLQPTPTSSASTPSTTSTPSPASTAHPTSTAPPTSTASPTSSPSPTSTPSRADRLLKLADQWCYERGSFIVSFGSCCALIGAAQSNMMFLRVLQLCAGLSYFAFNISRRPALVAAARWNGVFFFVNSVMLIGLLREHKDLSFTEPELDVFECHFLSQGMSPRRFRSLLNRGTWRFVPAGTTIAQEGKMLDQLMILQKGEIVGYSNDIELNRYNCCYQGAVVGLPNFVEYLEIAKNENGSNSSTPADTHINNKIEQTGEVSVAVEGKNGMESDGSDNVNGGTTEGKTEGDGETPKNEGGDRETVRKGTEVTTMAAAAVASARSDGDLSGEWDEAKQSATKLSKSKSSDNNEDKTSGEHINNEEATVVSKPDALGSLPKSVGEESATKDAGTPCDNDDAQPSEPPRPIEATVVALTLTSPFTDKSTTCIAHPVAEANDPLAAICLCDKCAPLTPVSGTPPPPPSEEENAGVRSSEEIVDAPEERQPVAPPPSPPEAINYTQVATRTYVANRDSLFLCWDIHELAKMCLADPNRLGMPLLQGLSGSLVELSRAERERQTVAAYEVMVEVLCQSPRHITPAQINYLAKYRDKFGISDQQHWNAVDRAGWKVEDFDAIGKSSSLGSMANTLMSLFT